MCCHSNDHLTGSCQWAVVTVGDDEGKLDRHYTCLQDAFVKKQKKQKTDEEKKEKKEARNARRAAKKAAKEQERSNLDQTMENGDEG